MSAQRYPEDYDGVIAGAPANDWTGLMLGFTWNAQAQLASADSYIPPTKAAAIQAAVNQQCDKIDGVADGVIGAPLACKLDDAALLCKGAPADTCLTAVQLATWNKIRRGAQNSKGVPLFSGFTPGAEVGSISGQGWDGWIFGQTAGNSTQGRFARNFMREVVSGDPNWQYGTFNFDTDAAAMTAKYAPILNATDPDLSRFIARGGKVIMFHGWADAAVPPLNSIKYYDSVVAKVGKAKSGEAVRLFMVPGMQHCFVGPGPSSFGGIAPAVSPPDSSSDLSAALEQWVEKGVAPEQVRATKPKNPLDGVFGPVKGGAQRTGLLCAYPRRAQWNGKDSSDDAASYTCAD
jgi:feruloyl esterase